MSMTGLDVFDTTVQKTNIWLKDILRTCFPPYGNVWTHGCITHPVGECGKVLLLP